MIEVLMAIALAASLVVFWWNYRWAYRAGYYFVKESDSKYGLTEEEIQGMIDGCRVRPVKKGMQKAAAEIKGSRK